MIRSHHERPDGNGYPRGLKGDDVPLAARILNVVDAFDAMTSDRPYRKALPIERVIKELETYKGKQFDEQVADHPPRSLLEGRVPAHRRGGRHDRDLQLPRRARAGLMGRDPAAWRSE